MTHIKYFDTVNGLHPQRYKCDARILCKRVPTDRIHRLCITSPPYWMLRDYENDYQIGLEETPEQYIAELQKVWGQAWARVTGDGSMVIVVGDSYFGGGSTTKRGNDAAMYKAKSTLSGTHPGGSKRPVKPRKHKRYKAGEQIGIPWMIADSLRDCGWMVRQVAIWHKPNPMPGPFRKRLTSSHEYIIHATKSMQYVCNREALDDGTRIMRDVITCPVSSGGHRHNAGFPMALIRPYIEAFTNRGDLVLDPFAGSGQIANLCTELGRGCTLCDVNDDSGAAG